jgi:predicted Zn-dependent peptidase
VVYEVNESSLLEGTTLGMQILGERETVSSLTKEDIISYINDNYCGDKTVIGISGNFNEEEMLAKVREYFSDMPPKSKADGYYAVPFNKKITLKTMQTEQTHMMMCFEGIGIEHKDLYPLQVCMFILGTGTSSMLYQKIREELGLCYSVDSWLGRYRGGGYIAVSVSLSPDSEEKAINEITSIVGDFHKKVTQRQVDIAKEKLISSLIMSREQPQSKFSSMGYNQLMLSRFVDDDEIISKIKAITLDDVVAVSEKYLRLDEMAFTAVGKVKDKAEYEKILAKAIKSSRF